MNTVVLNRKPVFDAVRAILGRGFTKDEVALIDSAIDRALGSANNESLQHRLGLLSEQFESGGRGPGAVSIGHGDPGGVSYGTYQLASRTGTVARFVKAEGARWQRELRDPPGSAAFSNGWRAIAEREPDAFAAAQHAFIKRTHYDRAVEGTKRKTGVDLDTYVDAVRDVVWSVAVQHGGAVRILCAAIAEAGANDARMLIKAIYATRTAYVLQVAGRSGGAVRRTLESITRNRYPAERKAALAMLDAS